MIKYNDAVITKLTKLLWDEQYERVACLLGKQVGDDILVLDVLAARNEDARPAEEFYISSQQMERVRMEAQRRGYLLLGVGHSHLPHHPPTPSEADIRYCRHAVNIMYHPASNTLCWFDREGEFGRQIVEPPWHTPDRMAVLAPGMA